MRKRKKIPKFCDYGCGRIATYYFPKAKKWCCEDHYCRCPFVRKGLSKRAIGNIPWNKGLTKEDHPGIAKQASKIKGRKYTKEHREHMSESAKNKVFSKEHRRNMSISAKKRCTTEEFQKRIRENNPMSDPKVLAKKIKSTQWFYDSIRGKSRPEHSLALSGPNHFNWQGGKSFEEYCAVWCDEFRDMIRERDGFRCQVCGSEKTEGENLSVHHIDGDKKNCSLDNVITLCRSCHTKIHFMKGDLETNLRTALILSHPLGRLASPFVPAPVDQSGDEGRA